MATVLALSGSPSRTSRTALLAEHTAAGLRARGHRTHLLALRELPAAPLLAADTHDASLARAVSLVAEADALVVATPIYQAVYSGLLKTFLDLLPQHAFAGKPVLPLATGGSSAHVLALDYALRPVLTALGAQVCQGRFVLDRHITTAPDGAVILDDDVERQLARTADQFARALPSRAPLTAA
ncbi:MULTISPECIES: NADPH-dependent FMN reductase [Streptomyces]|uniref:NADPH-dependent FMN reductase n=2 Tax=Streptomyces TaxID=1883 RepID=A0A100Y7B5_9ACTN|nr:MULTISPECIES: NADPH-dependent FMN reductase [Streptomyces]KUH39012.1 NADPH-dependent FMN reductase [Streptomyces kanasensis]UUS34572.1 NADPH-dependent FMN reductase [Streptomyces changanensis]